MFKFRFTSDAQPRSKKGQPAQSTTGVANANSIQLLARKSTNIRINSGTVTATLTQKRRVISSNSGWASSPPVTSRGSNAMPQIGHAPGLSRTISGCIGQVYCALTGAGAGSLPSLSNFFLQPGEQK